MTTLWPLDPIGAPRAAAIQSWSQQAHDRREHHQVGGHRNRHADRRGDPHHRQQSDAADGESRDRDDDGETRGQDRPTGGGGCLGDGIVDVATLIPQLPVARQDDESVVDAHTESDHGGQLRRQRRHVGEVRDHQDDCEPDAQAGRRQQQRNAGGQHRPEHDDEDDQRSEDAEDLAAPFGIRRHLG